MSSISGFLRTLCALALALASLRAGAQQVAATPSSNQFGGVHELNFYVGHSWHGGPILGYVRNVKYTTYVARYSYQLRDYHFATLRWAPEATMLADLYEPAPSPNNIHTDVPSREYGAGLSPANLQLVALPHRRVQPYLNADGGFILYNKPTLSDGGTKFMFTVDIGGGANIFLTHRDAATLGFRYQHQSNADIGQHNPGADSEIVCFGYSHFFNLPAKHGR